MAGLTCTFPLACHVPSNTPGLSSFSPSSFSQEYFGWLMRRSALDDIALNGSSLALDLDKLERKIEMNIVNLWVWGCGLQTAGVTGKGSRMLQAYTRTRVLKWRGRG